MSLDDKLREILSDQQYLDGDLTLSPEHVAEGIAQIKQAFADKGYINFLTLPKGIYNASGKALVQISSEQAMTGKEWYNRFEKEIRGFTFAYRDLEEKDKIVDALNRYLDAAKKVAQL